MVRQLSHGSAWEPGRNRKKPRAGPGRQGTEEDRRMKLAMVTTNYRITYYIHFRKEGFQLYQLKERGRLPSIPGQTSDNIVGGRGV